jgi:hypothetical protein
LCREETPKTNDQIGEEFQERHLLSSQHVAGPVGRRANGFSDWRRARAARRKALPEVNRRQL